MTISMRWLAWTSGAARPIAIHLIVFAVITFIAAMVAPETAGRELDGA